MHPTACKYLRFQWNNRVFEFTSLPFGLAPAPLVFTKLLKPVAMILRKESIRILIYLDDMLVMAANPSLLKQHLKVVTYLLKHLGFILNQKKCVMTPTQSIEFLGFRVGSTRMTLSLPLEKVHKVQKECRHTCNMSSVTGRQLAHLIGLMTSTLPAIQEAPLHYRALQRLKIAAVSSVQPDYSNTVKLSSRGSSGLKLVDKLLGNHDCSSHIASLSLSHTRDRCLNTKMGCLSPRIKCSNRRTMVTSRIQESYQLVGAEGCLPSSSIFHQQFPPLPRPNLYGQCCSHCLHQSEGGHSFSKAVPSCPGVLGLVCSETNHHAC